MHPEIYVLRHGETEWNRDRRMQGWLDSPLTARGRAQAARQAEILAAEGALGLPLYCSTAGRTRATAEIAMPGVPAVLDDRLREISLGSWDGLTGAEIAATGGNPPGAFGEGDGFWWYDTTPGEKFAGLKARIDAFATELTGPAVIVTHGIASMFLRGALLGLDLDGIADLPGGQGVVYHLKDGMQRRLT